MTQRRADVRWMYGIKLAYVMGSVAFINHEGHYIGQLIIMERD
jgi:hypothetical protein